MKKVLCLVLILLATLSIGSAFAYSYWDSSLDSYEVTLPSNQKVIYMYSKASSSGNPISSYSNGTIVRVIDYNASNSYCHAIGPDEKTGYLRKAWLTKVSEYSYDDALDEYKIIAEQRNVYLFKEASESGEPISAYTKGAIVKMIDYDASNSMAYVVCPDGKVGYIRKNTLMRIYDYEDESLSKYRVTSTYSTGYVYMYSEPNSNGSPLARYDNGTILKAIDYFSSEGYCLVVGPDGNSGYVSKKALTAESDSGSLGPVFEVFSTKGYCYMYAKPNSGSANLGRYDNGENIEIIDWGADKSYAFVRGVKNDKYGYIQKSSLHPSSVNPVKGYMKIRSTSNSYAYLYQKASDGSTNLGRYSNETQVGILDWATSEKYALVLAPDGKIGYIKKNCLVSLFS